MAWMMKFPKYLAEYWLLASLIVTHRFLFVGGVRFICRYASLLTVLGTPTGDRLLAYFLCDEAVGCGKLKECFFERV
jgi:hypothetical protein